MILTPCTIALRSWDLGLLLPLWHGEAAGLSQLRGVHGGRGLALTIVFPESNLLLSLRRRGATLLL